MRPFAHAEGHDLPWLVDEVVPGLAAQRDDVFVGFEDPVRQPVVAHELPDIQRYHNAYLFGAICPAHGKGAALMLPWADAQAMQMHLDEISRHVARKAHAVVLMDRAGWHTTGKLKVPKNLTIILLPSRAPELNPVENIWQYLRANWLSNRVFEDYNAIVDAGCEAWNKLIAQPETITSIGMRKWAHIGQC